MSSSLTKSILLSLCISLIIFSSTSAAELDDDEDLSFLEEPKPPAYGGHDHGHGHGHGHGYAHSEQHAPAEEHEEHVGEVGAEHEEADHGSEEHTAVELDEKDVVVLNGTEFADLMGKKKKVFVQFFAPWCGHCQALAPEYAAAATELKEEVVLAKVDATVESKLADEYKVEGFPSMYLLVDGNQTPYHGPPTKDAIVAWLKKKTGSGVYNVSTVDEATKILAAHHSIVVAFLDSLTGPETKELQAASQEEDILDFYQTSTPDVAKLFQIDPTAKRPVLVLLKQEAEKLTTHSGDFSKSAILEFVSANKFPLVMNFTRETGPIIFDHPIKKQIMLFATANESHNCLPAFQEAAKASKGKVVFVYVESDNEEFGAPMADYFGLIGNSSKLIAYTGVINGKKFLYEAELTEETIKTFAAKFVADKLEPFYKSEPIPEDNNSLVKIVVGKNFDELVLDESKDVLLAIYAPWCPHSRGLERPYHRLALYLSEIDSIVIAKMDGTTNEHPKAKSDGFPTIQFFQAGNKTSEPITFEGDRTAKDMYKFIKKYASIPFKVKNPVSSPDPEQPVIETEVASDELRDEL